MMIRNNDIDPQRSGVAHHVVGADTRIHADNQRDSRGSRLLDHFAAHPVSVAKAVRDVERCAAAGQLDSLHQDHDGACAVGVVVAIKQYFFFAIDGPAEPGGCRLHVSQQQRIMKIGQTRRKETARLLRVAIAASPQHARGRRSQLDVE
jgi:hypothetical protein